jgi:hypothetical protein
MLKNEHSRAMVVLGAFFERTLLLMIFILAGGLAGCNQEASPTVVTHPVQTSVGDWWQPAPGTTWQWQLSGGIDTSYDVEMYDIDLFEAPPEVIKQLQDAGRTVICYFSAGSWEDWRPDAGAFPPELLGKPLQGWPGERWLDIRQIELLAPLMTARLDLAVDKGCDGVEPDNIDGYQINSGFPLEYADQLNYNRWLAAQAHARGLSIGLKNDLEQIPDLLDDFDWALNEECFSYHECDLLLPFISAGKAVFGVEYELDTADFCPQANAMGFSFLRKNWELDAWRIDCREQ